MELDSLKQMWKQSEKIQKPEDLKIMELIQHKSNRPVAALRRGFKKQMILIPVMVAVIIHTFRHHEILTDVVFWCFIAFCMALCLFFYFNYRLASKMESRDGMIKSNLEHQVAILEKRLRWHMTGIRIILLFFIILTEVITGFAHEPMIEKWHAVSPFIRVLVYAAFLLFQYFVSRFKSKRMYGQHLAYLKQLLKEMQ